MIALNETLEYAAEVAFTLPLDSDPLTGLTGHTFVLGQVKVKLPGQAWANVAVSKIVEKGYGRFAARLTSSQTTTAGDVFLTADVPGAQFYFGTDVIDVLGGDIGVGSSGGSIPFFLADATDPLNNVPLFAHTFTTGQVRLCLPDGVYQDADISQIENIGSGGYRLKLTAAQTAKRGKAFIYANVPGAQRFEGYVTILGTGAAEEEEESGGGVVIPTPVVFGDPTYINQLARALNRLPQQFRSGTLNYDSVSDTTVFGFDLPLDGPLG
jgi:hypothetical protein